MGIEEDRELLRTAMGHIDSTIQNLVKLSICDTKDIRIIRVELWTIMDKLAAKL